MTSPSGKKSVYDIGKAVVRKKLRRIFARRIEDEEDYAWVLRYKTESTKKTASRSSFAEGFNPGPSSPEESSDGEFDYEENTVKSKTGSKKKATTKTTVGCKPTKETGKKDIDDDDEDKVSRKKSNSTSMKNAAKNQRGDTGKSVNTTKRTGGITAKQVSQSKRMIMTVLAKS